jgi:hypothetical protein
MARLSHGGENIGLREFLIEYADTVLMPVMGTCKRFVDSVEPLKAGGEYTFHRYGLRDDHAARREASCTITWCSAPTMCCDPPSCPLEAESPCGCSSVCGD